MMRFRTLGEGELLRWATVTAVVATALIPVFLSLGYLFGSPWLHRLWAVATAVVADALLVAGVTPSGRRSVFEALARVRWGMSIRR